MLHVERHEIKAQMKSSCSNEQVWEVDAVALTHLFAMDAAGQPSYLQSERIHCHGAKYFFDKGLPA